MKKGPARDPFSNLDLAEESGYAPRPAVAKAAVRPRTSRNAGARLSKKRPNFVRDMTHTFQLEPLGAGRVSYLNNAKIGPI